MTDSHSANGVAVVPTAARTPFPFVRFLYAVGFAILAWLAFWFLIILGMVQFAVLLVTGRANEELKRFNLNLLQYLWEAFAFILFIRDDQPFPIGPFPKSH
jgi:hypothetical protein